MSIHVKVAIAVPGLNGTADANLITSGEISVDLSSNATIADALNKAGFDSTQILAVAAVGVWGKVRPMTFVLRDNDRVEIYRSLQADPKAARRARDDGTTQKKRKG